MRALVIHPGPNFSVADLHTGWVEALTELGVTVADFNLQDRLTFYEMAEIKGEKRFTTEQVVHLAAKGVQAACYEFLPDVVLCVSGFYLPMGLLDLMRARGAKVVILHTEEPYELSRGLHRAAHADLNLLNDPVNIEAYQAVGPTAYVPHAYRPALHYPAPPRSDLVSDFAFVGTGYPSRIDFFEAVDWDGIDAAFAGNWQKLTEDSPLRKFLAHDVEACCHNGETTDLYRATKVSANIYRREAEVGSSQGWSMGPREVELAATGTFFLRESRGEGDEVLSMLPTFVDPDDFSDQLRHFLGDDELRADLAAQARAAVAERTFTRNAQQLLQLLDQ